MKKNIVWFLFLITSPIFAQVTFGPKIGLGFSRENYAIVRKCNAAAMEGKDTKYIPVPTISMVVDIPLSKTISLRPEFGYRQQIYSIRSHNYFFAEQNYDVIISETFMANLNYLELPVNVVFKMPFFKSRLEILAGATLGRCIGGKGNYERDQLSIPYTNGQSSNNILVRPDNTQYMSGVVVQPENEKFIPFIGAPSRETINVKPYNFNINFGLGYKIAKLFLLNMTVNYGLTNIAPSEFKDVDAYFYDHYYDKGAGHIENTYSYTFSLAYMFNVKKKE
jgi:hypothetical protein